MRLGKVTLQRLHLRSYLCSSKWEFKALIRKPIWVFLFELSKYTYLNIQFNIYLPSWRHSLLPGALIIACYSYLNRPRPAVHCAQVITLISAPSNHGRLLAAEIAFLVCFQTAENNYKQTMVELHASLSIHLLTVLILYLVVSRYSYRGWWKNYEGRGSNLCHGRATPCFGERAITSKTCQFEDSTLCGVKREPDEKCGDCRTNWLWVFQRRLRGKGTLGRNIIKGGVKSKVRQQSRSAVPEAGGWPP